MDCSVHNVVSIKRTVQFHGNFHTITLLVTERNGNTSEVVFFVNSMEALEITEANDE